MTEEEVVGNLTIVYMEGDMPVLLWCTHADKLIGVSDETTTMAVLADNYITIEDGVCEWCGLCFNKECEYHSGEWTEEITSNLESMVEAENVARNLDYITEFMMNDEEIDTESFKDAILLDTGYEVPSWE